MIRHIPYDHVSLAELSNRISINKMVTYITEEYASSLTEERIAKAGNCDIARCNSLFRKYLNSSCLDFVNMFRITKSAILLQSTNKSISGIAFECGFTSLTEFRNEFQSLYLVAPKTYRLKKGK